MPLIEITGLRKAYGKRVAVDGVSFGVERGEIFGILGTNGAGKTTTVECLQGLRTADGGTIRVLDLDPVRDREALTRRVGVQLQESQLPAKLKVREALELFASFYPEPADIDELLRALDLTEKGKELATVRTPYERRNFKVTNVEGRTIHSNYLQIAADNGLPCR